MEISQEVANSFLGTSIALFSAAFIWFLKTTYEKHVKEMLILAKFERFFALNLRYLTDNFGFVDEWINSLKNNRPFSFYIQDYIVDDDESYKINNLLLINKLLPLNYKLKRTSFDLKNIYNNYWDNLIRIDATQDPQQKEINFKAQNENILVPLNSFKQNYEPLKNDIIEAVAIIREIHRVKRHSVPSYINLLFEDIFPSVTKESLKQQEKNLRDNIEKIAQ